MEATTKVPTLEIKPKKPKAKLAAPLVENTNGETISDAKVMRLGGMRLGQKLLLGALLLSTVPLLTALGINTVNTVNRSRTSLLEASAQQLTSVRDSKKREIEQYFALLSKRIDFLAEGQRTHEAIKSFSAGFAKLNSQANKGKPFSAAEIQARRQKLATWYETIWKQEYNRAHAYTGVDIKPYLSALSDNAVLLQYLYLASNPNIMGAKSKLNDAQDGSAYSAVHKKYHSEFLEGSDDLGFEDIHLIDPKTGILLYTTKKQIDIGQSLKSGPLVQSPIGAAYKLAMANPENPEVAIADSGSFVPGYSSETMFAAKTIMENNKLIGLMIAEIPVSQLNTIMTNDFEWESTGYGKTGEVYLVGPNSTMRSDSRFFVEDRENYLQQLKTVGVSNMARGLIMAGNTSIGKQPVQTEGTKRALNSESGVTVYKDYRGIEVQSAYAPLELPGLNWAIVSQKEISEATQPVTALQNNIMSTSILTIALALAASIGTAIFFVRSLTRPINLMMGVVQKFGRGDLSQLVPVKSKDEIGMLGQTLNGSILQLRDFLAKQEAERAQGQELQNNITGFLETAMKIADGDLTQKGRVTDDVLGNVVDAVNLMTEEIGGVLKDVSKATDLVTRGASEMNRTTVAIVQGAATQAEVAGNARVQTEEVTHKIREMAMNASSSATAARETLAAAQEGIRAAEQTLSSMQGVRREVNTINKAIKSLSERSLEISEIASAISSIASQTNLLALNAAIEAAGAGDAGGRFSLVADEVRKLATDAAKSAKRVGGLIDAIQSEVQAVTSSIEAGTGEVEIGFRNVSQNTVRLQRISDLANQSASLAANISTNAQTQAGNIEQVNSAVQTMAQTAETTQSESLKGRRAAEELRLLAEQLDTSLSRFQLPSGA